MDLLFQEAALFHVSIKHFFPRLAFAHLEFFNYFQFDFLESNIPAKTVFL